MEEENNVQEEKKPEENKIKKEDIEKKPSRKKENLTDKMRENPWIISTLVLGILGLMLFVGNFYGGMAGNVISGDEAGEALAEFAKSQIGDIEITNVEKENGLHKIYYSSIQGEGIVYLTLDGKNLVNGLIPLSIMDEESSQQQEPEDWSIFANELPENIKSKILSFNYEEPEIYDKELKIDEFKNYDFIPNTLIVFYNPGCGACRGYLPVLVEVKEKYPEINIYALNSGQNRDFTEKYDMNYVPTTIINLKYKIVGGNSLESLSEILDELNK